MHGNPFEEMGTGMMFFFKYLYDMPKIFLLYAILASPIIYCYRDFTPKGMDLKSIDTTFGRFSIANLGMDSIKENQFSLELSRFSLSCPFGRISSAIISVHNVG